MLRNWDIIAIVSPVRAFPTGKPINPRTPPVPSGPYISPGSSPAIAPAVIPAIGPPYSPAIKTAIREKSKDTPGAI